MIIAFDVDNTLVVDSLKGRSVPNYPVISILHMLQQANNRIVIWSGSGVDYAESWAEKLGLENVEIRRKEKSLDVDVCFDDQQVDLAKCNIQI